MNEKKYWLWLTMVFGVGSDRIWRVMCLYEKASDAYNSLKNNYSHLRLSEDEAKNIRSIPLSKAEEFIAGCESRGIDILCYSDEEYPNPLKHIYNPPSVLYCKGNISCLKNRRTLTAVGARNVTAYGAAATDKICRELAAKGVLIVSGFAIGTDITAHLAAVRQHKPTVCVLGCGVDVDYPKGNLEYRKAILENGGLFISEYPPGTPPHGYNFPKRNRILAALGRVTAVFEASIKSGSLITASIASDQGREVFCLPPANIFNAIFGGNCALIRDGATPILSSDDIFDCFKAGSAVDIEIRAEVYNGIGEYLSEEKASDTEELRTEKYMTNREGSEDADEHRAEEQNEDTEEKKDRKLPEAEVDMSGLSELQTKIVTALGRGSLHADALAGELGLDPSELMTELTELELTGTVRALPGKMYEIRK